MAKKFDIDCKGKTQRFSARTHAVAGNDAEDCHAVRGSDAANLKAASTFAFICCTGYDTMRYCENV